MLFDAPSIFSTIISHKDLLKGKTFVQMSTIAAEDNLKIQQEVQQAGGQFIESPVLGTNTVAKARNLQVLVGCSEEQFNSETLKRVLSCFGTVKYIGEIPKASNFKLVMNQMVLAQVTTIANSLGMLERSDINVDIFMDVLRNSAFHSKYFDFKLPQMQNRKYQPLNFDISGAKKDIDLITERAKNLGLNTSFLEGIQATVAVAAEMHKNDDADFASIYDAINPPQQK